MGYIRVRRRQFWSAGASEARPRFGSLGPEFRHSQSAVAAALCRRTPKVPRVAYPADSSLCTSCDIPRTPWCPENSSYCGSIDRRQLEQVFDEREHDAIHPLDLRVRRFDDVIFVRRMGAAAVAEAEMAGWQTE